MQNDAIYKGNDAADFQPTTQNPQSTGTSLQQGTSNDQSDITQQRLPSVNNLKVVIVQDANSSTAAGLTPVQAVTQTWVGPFWGVVILVVIGVIVWSVRVLAKDEVSGLPEALQDAANEPLIADIPEEPKIITAPKKVKKTATKKATLKKATKKRSKRK